MLSTILSVLGCFGLLLIVAGYFYIKKCGGGAHTLDPISLIIAMTYKYVIGGSMALLALGVLFKYLGW